MSKSIENLSENLFKPRTNTQETSCMIQYLAQSEQLLADCQKKHPLAWYRSLPRALWSWQGIDPIEIEQTLAKIAASSNQPPNTIWLDTIAGFKPGNWSYEWTQLGMQYQRQASGQANLENNLLNQKISQNYLKASTCFSIASFPHLRNDQLAMNAQVLMNQAYTKAMSYTPYRIEKIQVPYQGKKVTAYLHLPEKQPNSPLPVVIASAGIDHLQTDLWQLFMGYLAPKKIALLTLDLPGVGQSSAHLMREDASFLHEALLLHIPQIPWVDQFNVHLMGFRFTGNLFIRLAFLRSDLVRSVVSIGAPVDHWFSQSDKIKAMPKVYLDTIASRMGKKVIDLPNFAKQLRAWSLTTQGILANRPTKVPILMLNLDGDYVGHESEAKKVAMFSQGGRALKVKHKSLHQGYDELVSLGVDWIDSKIKS